MLFLLNRNSIKNNKYFQINNKNILLKPIQILWENYLLCKCKSFQFVFELYEIKGLQSYKYYVEIVLSDMCNVGTVNCFYPKSKVINIQHAWRCGSVGLGKGELGEKINSSSF